MIKSLLLALVVASPMVSLAQSSNLDAEVSAELDKMYKSSAPKKSLIKKKTTTQVYEVTSPTYSPASADTADVSGGLTETMVSEAPAVQKQPKAYIESTPLTESKAEKLRKARQEQEVYTEQTMVEKLEQSRIDDEKKRGDVLFGDKFTHLKSKEAANGSANSLSSESASANGNNSGATAPSAAAPAPSLAPAPAPVINVVIPEQAVKAPVKSKVEQEEEALDGEVSKGESSASLAAFKDEALVKKSLDSTYFSANLGMGEYDATNVKGQYALGFAFGKLYQQKMAVEGAFQYSNYQVEQNNGGVFDNFTGAFYPRITEMDQYNGSFGVKYYFLTGALKPMVGGLLSYTYRTFRDTQFALTNETSSSTAFDAGLNVGFDLEMSESFSVGLDVKYLKNLTSRVNNGGLQRSQTNQYPNYSTYYSGNTETAVEKVNYWIVGIVGKSTF